MIVKYKLDAGSASPRFVSVSIVDGLASPEAIAAESLAALVALRASGEVAPWRTAGIEVVDGEAWHGASGAHRRLIDAAAGRIT